jgi:hypothetical protein
VDWRFLLGIGPESVVVADHVDEPDGPLMPALAPWVARVLSPGPAARDADWVFVGAASEAIVDEARLRAALDMTRSGGHIALAVENRYGLHWLADWRPPHDEMAGCAALRSGYTRARSLLQRAGAVDVRAYALLPHHEAPRAIIPVEPPCPPVAQRLALEQVWQRATPLGAAARALLGLGISSGLMRRLYPHYLLVGRKP